MAKTRGTTGVAVVGGGVRKQSKENVMAGGVTRIVKVKVTAGVQARKNAKSALATVENLTQQTRGLRLDIKNGGVGKDCLVREPRKCSKKVAKSKTTANSDELDTLAEDIRLVPADLLPEGVSDIDDCDDDSENPQSVAENVKHIYAYLRHMEEKYPVPQDFLRSTVITARMRSILINWLAQVSLQFKLLQETLYLTVDIIDRFLFLQGTKLQYKSLQLVGVAAMLIACKYEEMYVPEVSDFVFITDQAYDSKEILSKELDILRALNFNLGKPISLNFLRRNSKAGYVGVKHHSLAKYILEESLPNYALASVKPSEKAAAALLISMKILEPTAPLKDLWCANLVFYSGYSLAELTSTSRALTNCILAASSPSNKFRAAFDKYNCNKHGHVAQLPQLHKETLQEFVDVSP